MTMNPCARSLSAPLLVWAALCAGCVDGGTDKADDTATSSVAPCVAGETVTADGVDYTLRQDGLQVLDVATNLGENGFQSFTAETCDWTFGDTWLDIFETGASDLNNGWNEPHVLPSTRFTDGDVDTPPTDHLELAIDHVDSIGELSGGEATLFDDTDADNLTYALRVYDAAGALADCVVWGHDVAAMFAGAVPSNNTATHTDFSEVTAASCTTLNP